jgi:acetoin utilization deacetylase AcuC-like enzyme
MQRVPLPRGNGTNDIFRGDPSVLFISAHEVGLCTLNQVDP